MNAEDTPLQPLPLPPKQEWESFKFWNDLINKQHDIPPYRKNGCEFGFTVESRDSYKVIKCKCPDCDVTKRTSNIINCRQQKFLSDPSHDHKKVSTIQPLTKFDFQVKPQDPLDVIRMKREHMLSFVARSVVSMNAANRFIANGPIFEAMKYGYDTCIECIRSVKQDSSIVQKLPTSEQAFKGVSYSKVDDLLASEAKNMLDKALKPYRSKNYISLSADAGSSKHFHFLEVVIATGLCHEKPVPIFAMQVGGQTVENYSSYYMKIFKDPHLSDLKIAGISIDGHLAQFRALSIFSKQTPAIFNRINRPQLPEFAQKIIAVGCLGHRLNNSAKALFNKDEPLKVASDKIIQIMREYELRSVPKPVPTRWCYWFDCCDYLIENCKSFLNIPFETLVIHKLLFPLKAAIGLFEANYNSICLVWPILCEIETRLIEMLDDDSIREHARILLHEFRSRTFLAPDSFLYILAWCFTPFGRKMIIECRIQESYMKKVQLIKRNSGGNDCSQLLKTAFNEKTVELRNLDHFFESFDTLREMSTKHIPFYQINSDEIVNIEHHPIASQPRGELRQTTLTSFVNQRVSDNKSVDELIREENEIHQKYLSEAENKNDDTVIEDAEPVDPSKANELSFLNVNDILEGEFEEAICNKDAIDDPPPLVDDDAFVIDENDPIQKQFTLYHLNGAYSKVKKAFLIVMNHVVGNPENNALYSKIEESFLNWLSPKCINSFPELNTKSNIYDYWDKLKDSAIENGDIALSYVADIAQRLISICCTEASSERCIKALKYCDLLYGTRLKKETMQDRHLIYLLSNIN